jgi:hypothetical protein
LKQKFHEAFVFKLSDVLDSALLEDVQVNQLCDAEYVISEEFGWLLAVHF